MFQSDLNRMLFAREAKKRVLWEPFLTIFKRHSHLFVRSRIIVESNICKLCAVLQSRVFFGRTVFREDLRGSRITSMWGTGSVFAPEGFRRRPQLSVWYTCLRRTSGEAHSERQQGRYTFFKAIAWRGDGDRKNMRLPISPGLQGGGIWPTEELKTKNMHDFARRMSAIDASAGRTAVAHRR